MTETAILPARSSTPSGAGEAQTARPDKCPLCGTPTAALRPWLTVPLDVKRRQPLDSGALVWCDACDFGTTLQQPDDRQLAAAYDLSAYYTHGGTHFPQVTATVADRVLTKVAYLVDRGQMVGRDQLLALVPEARSVLDIGCGNGDFLAGLAGQGRRLVGVDPDPNARKVAKAKGLEVLTGTAEALPEALSGQRFDLITMTHVLEHCRDPLVALRNARDLLTPSGAFFCEVPNCGSVYFQTYAAISEMLDVPRHLHFFTRTALSKLCSASGLTVLGWNHHGYTRHFGAAWRAWENEIHNQLVAEGPDGPVPRRNWLGSLALIARSMAARPDRKYDCIGLFARAA
jgi:2-polyprenyl-3-methyl-5-hydroxy-6-metoxy-1,4-benzoquinol methylase